MSKPSKDSSMIGPTIWKSFPHRLKGLLKREKIQANSPRLTASYTKSKSSLIYRIFPTNKNKKHKVSKDNSFIQLKKSQWGNNPDFHVSEIDLATEVPLRANLMSFFNTNAQQQQQQQGWPRLLNTNHEKLDNVSRVYIGTLSKIRLLSHYTMEQQLAIHHLLSRIQNKTQQQHQQQQKKTITRSGNNGVFQRDFNSLLSGRVSDTILMNNRKPRRTRYIFMLLSTPSSHVINKIHPVTDAISKLRRPYAETFTVITSEMILEEERQEIILKEKERRDNNVVAYKFVPADYLLDPTTLRGRGEPQNRLGTKFSGSTNHHQQQQDVFISTNNNNNNNNDSSTIAPFMAKIQIQTN